MDKGFVAYDSASKYSNVFRILLHKHMSTGREVYELLLCYRVLRWRAREYASLFMNVDKIDDCLRNVEKLQMKAAYNLLHDAGVTETGNILNTLRKLDRSLTDSIRQS